MNEASWYQAMINLTSALSCAALMQIVINAGCDARALEIVWRISDGFQAWQNHDC
jgi:hypothetical protein